MEGRVHGGPNSPGHREGLIVQQNSTYIGNRQVIIGPSGCGRPATYRWKKLFFYFYCLLFGFVGCGSTYNSVLREALRFAVINILL